MSSAEVIGYYGSQALMIYLAADENLIGAVLVPVAGQAAKEVGKYCHLKSIQNIGRAVSLGGLMGLPGALVGRAIRALCNEEVPAKVSSIFMGIFVAFETHEFMMK